MKLESIVTIVAVVFFASVAYSGEQTTHKMEIKVVADDGDGETRLVLDSDDMDFDLKDMQVGENQSIVDKQGRAVLVTRTADGYSFDVDGKKIDMPAFDSIHSAHAPDVDVDVHVSRGSGRTHKSRAPHAMFKSDGVVIISGTEIDDATRQIIRTALESAGHDEVRFVGAKDGIDHQVRVVQKVVEVSN